MSHSDFVDIEDEENRKKQEDLRVQQRNMMHGNADAHAYKSAQRLAAKKRKQAAAEEDDDEEDDEDCGMLDDNDEVMIVGGGRGSSSSSSSSSSGQGRPPQKDAHPNKKKKFAGEGMRAPILDVSKSPASNSQGSADDIQEGDVFALMRHLVKSDNVVVKTPPKTPWKANRLRAMKVSITTFQELEEAGSLKQGIAKKLEDADVSVDFVLERFLGKNAPVNKSQFLATMQNSGLLAGTLDTLYNALVAVSNKNA